MRRLIFGLALIGLGTPVAGLADEPSAQMNAVPQRVRPSGAAFPFEQLREQFTRLQAAERSQFLASLSPAHRQLLAQTAGELAVAQVPDFASAARRLNAALTPAESAAILQANAAYREQLRSALDAARAQYLKSLPPDQVYKIEQNRARSPSQPRTERQPDAGTLLLLSAYSTMRGPGPGVPPAQPIGVSPRPPV